MGLIRSITRGNQRLFHDLKTYLAVSKIRYVILLTIMLVVSAFVLIYKDESYQYTSTSMQVLSDKINLISNKIDSYKLMEDTRQKTMIPEEPKTTIEAKPAVSAAAATPAKSVEQAQPSEIPAEYQREKAVILIFARNIELYKLMETLWSFEQRFNQNYGYNYLIVTDGTHTSNFKKNILAIVSTNVEFHTVSRLGAPPGLDASLVKEGKKTMREKKVKNKKTQRQRHQERFMARAIFEIEALNKYDYYLRVDPGVFFYCDVNFDVFRFMRENERTYGFGFTVKGEEAYYTNTWGHVLKYIEENSGDIHKNNMIDFISDDKGESFNHCIIKADFEVGDLNFFRSEKVKKLADYLDDKKGIYYEGWDESITRTLAVTLLEDKRKIQFFNNLGYNDRALDNMKSCPYDQSIRIGSNCICDPLDDITWRGDSCVEHFFKVNGYQIPGYIEDSRKARAEIEEQKKKEEEKNRYEQEQADKIRQQEEEEKKKIDEQNNKDNKEE